MHAYAAEDPVFLAMNARGQQDTDGALGDFCVRCHAPMAVADGDTVDGLNLDQVAPEKKGVTCFFCHNATQVDGLHNNPLQLARDQTMRGGIADAVDPGVHGAQYSELHDGGHLDSAALCGACHDIVTPDYEVHLERTFLEWKGSLFSGGDGTQAQMTCAGCHMNGREGPAASASASAGADAPPTRRTHSHLWPAVDLALSDFPGVEMQRRAIACELASVVVMTMEIDPMGKIVLRLETNAGHGFPSGSSQDRRLWVELIGYDAAGEVVYSSGAVADDEVVGGTAPGDALGEGVTVDTWVLRDWMFDVDGAPTHDFWRAAPSTAHPRGYESLALPPPARRGEDHFREHVYSIYPLPERITARVRVRPVGLDVLDALIAEGYLAGEVRQRMPTLEVTQLQWQREDGFGLIRQGAAPELDCELDCLGDPGACD
jgi:hypothetical protein